MKRPQPAECRCGLRLGHQRPCLDQPGTRDFLTRYRYDFLRNKPAPDGFTFDKRDK